MAHGALEEMVSLYVRALRINGRFIKHRLTGESAVKISLQPSVVCKSTFCQPFAASGPRARNNLYCLKHASRRFTLTKRVRQMRATLYARARSRQSMVNTLVSLYGAHYLFKVSLILRLSHSARILVVQWQYTSNFNRNPICPIIQSFGLTAKWRPGECSFLVANDSCALHARTHSDARTDQSLQHTWHGYSRCDWRRDTCNYVIRRSKWIIGHLDKVRSTSTSDNDTNDFSSSPRSLDKVSRR